MAGHERVRSAVVPLAALGNGYRSILLLSLGAGAVDSIVISGFQILTAAQTGNTILLAVALAQGNWFTGLYSGISVLGFILGALAGACLLLRARWRVVAVLSVEIVLLTGACSLWLVRGSEIAVVGTTACAMGLQSAVMLHLRGSSTTYMTGVLASFARHLALPQPAPDSTAHAARSEATVWVLYFAGAIAGGWLFLRYGSAVMILPLLCLATAAILTPRPAAVLP